jgi:hypothetical protein
VIVDGGVCELVDDEFEEDDDLEEEVFKEDKLNKDELDEDDDELEEVDEELEVKVCVVSVVGGDFVVVDDVDLEVGEVMVTVPEGLIPLGRVFLVEVVVIVEVFVLPGTKVWGLRAHDGGTIANEVRSDKNKRPSIIKSIFLKPLSYL